MEHIVFLVLKGIAALGLAFFGVFLLILILAGALKMNVKLEGFAAILVISSVAFYLWYFLPPFA